MAYSIHFPLLLSHKRGLVPLYSVAAEVNRRKPRLRNPTGAHPGEPRALPVRKHFGVPPLRSRPATRHDSALIFPKVFNFEFRIFNFQCSRSFAINPRTLDHPNAFVN